MKLAIMQPYFLPYIGYFQLIAAVDRIVLLDDVNYINRGWINRNRLPVNGEPAWFTMPIVGASQNKLINEIDILPDDGWKSRMTSAISTAYKAAPQYASVMPILEHLLASATGNLSTFLHHSLRTVCDHIGIRTEIIPTSSVHPKGELKGQQRILDICRREQATTYVNLPGGRELYEAIHFDENRIILRFLNPAFSTLKVSHSNAEGPVLSILDLLMLNEPDVVLEAAMSHSLTTP
jgi:hypothetical protein